MAKLYYYWAAMNAGKTTTLLQSSYNYQEQGMTTLLMKPVLDNREGGVAAITSRIGLTTPCLLIEPTTDLFASVSQLKIDCVLVDEAQFLTKTQVGELARIVDELEIPVLCYGLRTDFQGNLFPGSQWLLAWADNLIEIKGVCKCGRKATHVIRHHPNGDVITEGDQVFVGGNDLYLAVCRKHHTAMYGCGTINLGGAFRC